MKSKINIQLALSLALALAGSAMAAGSDSVQPLVAASGAAANHADKFTPAQWQEIQARVDLANSILKHVAADAAAKGATDTWRLDLLGSLYNTPSASLRNIAASATTLDQAHELASDAAKQPQGTASMAKSLGSYFDSLVYTPMTPCRFIDTRNVGGPITTPRDYDVFLSGSSYGGAASCKLPGGEPAFVANVTIVVPPGNPGFIGIRPYGSTEATSFINWEASGTSGLANAGVITTGLNSANSYHYEFEVFEGGGNAPQLIMDYFGYFEVATANPVALDCGSVEVSNFQTLPANSQSIYYTTASCGAGYTTVSAYCYNLGASNVYLSGSGVSSSGAFCSWINNSSTAVTVPDGATCCRVPSH